MIKCRMCGEEYDADDIRDLKDMHENFYQLGDTFICPDCWDNLQHKELDDFLDIMMKK